MWTHRNGYKHGPNGPDATELRERLTHKIEHDYETGTTTLLPRDHHWLSKPIDATLNLDTATQQQWLQSIAIARDRYQNQQSTDPNLAQQRTLLRNWPTNNQQTNH